jgi:hypothetical protein
VAAYEAVESGKLPDGIPQASSHLVTRLRRSASISSGAMGFPSGRAKVWVSGNVLVAIDASLARRGLTAGAQGGYPEGVTPEVTNTSRLARRNEGSCVPHSAEWAPEFAGDLRRPRAFDFALYGW